MDRAEITHKIRQIIAKVTSIPADQIAPEAALREELGLDSLSLLEVGVNVDYEFKLNLPDLDQRMAGITTLSTAVTLVEELLGDREGAAVSGVGGGGGVGGGAADGPAHEARAAVLA